MVLKIAEFHELQGFLKARKDGFMRINADVRVICKFSKPYYYLATTKTHLQM